MRNILLEEFAQALNPAEGCLKDNLLAHHLFVLCCNYSKQLTALDKRELKTFVQNLRALQPVGKPNIDGCLNEYKFESQTDDSKKDFRIKHMLLRGVRKFASPKSISDNKSFYLIDFSNNKLPQSTVLLGNNGIGKTSIFSALEYAFLDRIPSAEVKGIEDIGDYLQNKCNNIPWEIELNTNNGRKFISGDFDSSNQDLSNNTPIGYQASFCCQGDVEAVEHSEFLSDYIYDQLGLGFFYQLLSILTQEIKLEEKIKESYELINQRLQIKKDAYEKLMTKHSVYDYWAFEHLYYDEVKLVLKDIHQLMYDLDKGYVLEEDGIFKLEKGTVLKDAYSKLMNYDSAQLEKWESELNGITSFLKQRFQNLINNLYENILQPIISKLTKFYFYEIGDLDLTLHENFEFKIGINLKDGIDNPVPVNKVLNTFRIKVFTMSLKGALTCCAMKIYNSIFPLIIDDIFDSSDFSHRADIDYYFKNMIENYRKVMKEDFPVQIIFFTQDELIGEGVEKGIKDILGLGSVSMYRLIEPSDCDYLEIIREKGRECSRKDIQDDRHQNSDEEFKDWKVSSLTIRIPDTFITGYSEDESSE